MQEMEGILEMVDSQSSGIEAITFSGTALTLVIATAFGVVVALLHLIAHRDKPTTRLWRTLVLIAPLIAMATMAVGTNVAAAFTLFGTLAIVRFRTPIREPMDAAFVIFSVVIGLATGNQNFLVATVGTMVIALTILILLIQTGRSGLRTSGWNQTGRGRLKLVLGSVDASNVDWQRQLEEMGISYRIRSCRMDETASTTELVVELTVVSSDDWPMILGRLMACDLVTSANGGPLED